MKRAVLSVIAFFIFGMFSIAVAETVDDRYLNARLDVIHERLNAMDKALKLQAIEIERRLEALNQLRAEVVKDRGQFVKWEVYSSHNKEVDKLCNRVTAVETKIVTWMGALTFFFLAVQIVIKIWGHRTKN